MDDLIKVVSEKTGLPEAVAKQAVMAVVDHLGKDLPEPFGDMLDKYLAGDKNFGIDDAVGGLKDIFKF